MQLPPGIREFRSGCSRGLLQEVLRNEAEHASARPGIRCESPAAQSSGHRAV